MVNRIEQQNYVNPYAQKRLKTTKPESDAPAFLLQNEENGVVWDRIESQKKNDETKKTNTDRKAKEQNRQEEKVKPVNSEAEEITKDDKEAKEGIIAKISKLFQKCFRFIWYGEDQEKKENRDENENNTNDNTIKKTEKYSNDEQTIADCLQKKDTDGVMKILTQNYTISPARNTSLLTYYDKHGMIVNHGRTNTERILYGDGRKNAYLDSM